MQLAKQNEWMTAECTKYLLTWHQGKLDLEAVSDLINISQNPALASQVRSRQPSTTKPKKEVPSVDDDSRPLNQLVYEAIMNTEQKQMSLAEIVRCIFSVPGVVESSLFCLIWPFL